MSRLGFASDHAGFELKEILIRNLAESGHSITDYGTFSTQSCDYPDFAHLLAKAVENDECDFGFVLCGSGNGVNMVVNKHKGVRSALCWNPEIARLARLHNNANVCALPARFILAETGKEIMHSFLNTSFEGGRHENRVNKISCVD